MKHVGAFQLFLASRRFWRFLHDSVYYYCMIQMATAGHMCTSISTCKH